MKKISLIFLLHFVFAGCASVSLDTPANDEKRKQFSTYPDKAGLYIYHNQTFPTARKYTISVDGQVIGKLAPKTYLFKKIGPGMHKITSEGGYIDPSVTVNAKVGTNYFIWVKPHFFWVPDNEIHLVNESEGQLGVNECNLAITN